MRYSTGSEPMRPLLLTAYVLLAAASPAGAEIIAFECNLPSITGRIFFTWYSDGTPARVGNAPGIGDKALAFQDRFGAWIFVELNMDGSPISLSTIQRNMEVVHSRHVLQIDGNIVLPTQSKGTCKTRSL